MTRETKIGLLVGMGVIILIGILISDHLSVAQRQQQARLAEAMPPELAEDELPPPPAVALGGDRTLPPQQTEPLPLPGETASESARTRRSELQPPDVIRVDLLPELPADRRNRTSEAAGSSTAQSDDSGSRTPRRGSSDLTAAQAADDSPAWPPPGFEPAAGGGQDARPTTSGGEGQRATRGGNADRRESGRAAAPGSAGGGDESESIVHHVAEGETLSDIARTYFDDPNYWRSIYEANRSRIPNPDMVRSGVRLVIPNKAGRANASRTAQPRPQPAASSREADATGSYTVRSGDSLSKIAARHYGSMGAWRKLYELNKDRIEDPDSLRVGTLLRVPGN